jgi:O-antigen/teichoic acid export membrane protein
MTAADVTGTAHAPRPQGARLARLGLIAAMVSRVVGRLVGIVLVLVLARAAAPATIAVYGYLLGTATLLLTLTDLGVASVAGREVAAGRMPADGALAAALLPQLFSVVAASAVTIGLVTLAGPAGTPATALWMTVPYVIVGGMNNLWADVLRGTGRVVLEGALQVGSAGALVAAGVVVVYLGGSATDLLLVVVAKEVAVLAISFAVVRPRRRSGVRGRTLITQGAWVGLASSAVVLLWREGALVVGSVGSLTVLATYVVATRFFDAGITVAHTVGFGLGPGMSALADDPVAFRHAARKYLWLITALGIGVAVVGGLLAGPLTTIPFGARWEIAVPAVRMVAVMAPLILITYLCFAIFMARRQVRWLALSCIAGLVVGLTATILLMLHRSEAVSGVLGTLIGATVLVVLLLIGLRDLLLPVRSVDVGPRHLGELESLEVLEAAG